MKRNLVAVLICFNLYAISVAPAGTASNMWAGVLAYSSALKNACIGPSGLCTATFNLATAAGEDIYRNATNASQPLKLSSAVPTRGFVSPLKLASAKPTTPEAESSQPMPSWCQENFYSSEQRSLPVVQEMAKICREEASFSQE